MCIRDRNRTYRLSCDDGEEERLAELAAHVRTKADGLIAEHGRIGDEHLMLMSAILIADELWDLRAAQEAKAATAKARANKPAAPKKPAGEIADEAAPSPAPKPKSATAAG